MISPFQAGARKDNSSPTALGLSDNIPTADGHCKWIRALQFEISNIILTDKLFYSIPPLEAAVTRPYLMVARIG